MRIAYNYNNNNNKSKYRHEIIDPVYHLEERVRKKLIKRYDKPIWYHDVKMINDILYNEKTHFVELFKEYLIYEDLNEFLKRYYIKNEIIIKLPRILLFYDKYSKIYANYTVIPESKYMYKNIKRKQKMIDQIQNMQNLSKNENEDENLSNVIFNSKILDSINKLTMTICNNTNSKISYSEGSVNKLINKIDNFERRAEKIKLKNKFTNKHFSINNIIVNNKKKIKSYNLIQKKGNNKLGNSISNKLTTSNSNSKNKTEKKIISYSRNVKNNLKSKENEKSEKINSLLSSKIFHRKLFSSPILTKNHKNISPNKNNIINKKGAKLKNLFSNPSTYKPITQREKNYNILNTKNKKKNKSTSKNKENHSIINNYNIINNIQEGFTQINIYNGNELINSINFKLNNNSKSSSKKKININNNITYINNKSKQKRNKFDLNLRKIIHKHIIDNESSTERNNKNFFDKLGNYFLTKNSKKDYNSITKYSINESKLISKIINTNPQNRRINKYKSKEKNINYTTVKTSIQNNSLLNSNSNFKVRKIKSKFSLKDKFKLNCLNDLNKLYKKYVNSKGYSSERNKKTKNKIK